MTLYVIKCWVVFPEGKRLGLGFRLTFGLIVDPLQPNTLLRTMALQRQ